MKEKYEFWFGIFLVLATLFLGVLPSEIVGSFAYQTVEDSPKLLGSFVAGYYMVVSLGFLVGLWSLWRTTEHK